MAKKKTAAKAKTLTKKASQAQGLSWVSWRNRMPPGPHTLHVKGMVQVANSGIEASLKLRVPQGINPSNLDLELTFKQLPGLWLQVIMQKEVHYVKKNYKGNHRTVTIHVGGRPMITIPIQDVQ